jgi:hypothetical protein
MTWGPACTETQAQSVLYSNHSDARPENTAFLRFGDVQQACYIKTADADVVAAICSLENAPGMHLESMKKSQLM